VTFVRGGFVVVEEAAMLELEMSTVEKSAGDDGSEDTKSALR
jgi:hypothetical protein